MNRSTKKVLTLKQSKAVAHAVKARAEIRAEVEKIEELQAQLDQLIEGTSIDNQLTYSAEQLAMRASTLQSLVESKHQLSLHQPQLEEKYRAAKQHLLDAQLRLERFQK